MNFKLQTLVLRLMMVLILFPTTVGQVLSQTAIDAAPRDRSDGWRVAKPSQAGFDPAKLQQLTEDIKSNKIHNVHAVIIEHNGRLVYEQYFSGPDERWGRKLGVVVYDHTKLHDLRSVSKSVTTAILGIALAEQYTTALNKSISDYFPELQGGFGKGVENVKLKHVLTMTAGIEWNEMEVPYTSSENDEIRMSFTDKPIEMVLARDVCERVGSKWYYNGGLSQIIGGVIAKITGMPLDKYAESALFNPLDIKNYEWLGEPHWKSPSAASGLRLRARDMAKIGSVFLHSGKWNGMQVIPTEWIKLSTQFHVKNIPWGRSTGSYGYGFMWYPGVTNDEAKHRLIRAAGNGAQRIFILPDLGLNITMFAGTYNDWTHRSDAKVLNAVLNARKL